MKYVILKTKGREQVYRTRKTYDSISIAIIRYAAFAAALWLTIPIGALGQRFEISAGKSAYKANRELTNSFHPNTGFIFSQNNGDKSHFQYSATQSFITEDPKNISSVSPTGVVVTSAALAGLYTGLFSYEQDRRWGASQPPLHFINRLEAHGFDKFGHFYAAKSQAGFIANLYRLSGLSSTTSNILGASIAFSVQTLIEIKDGKIPGEGFDLYDQTANMLGIGWFYAREEIGFLQRFNIRWFYYPSPQKDLLSSNTRFTQDLNGHSYWMSFRLHDLLPLWPRFLEPAVGISLNDWSGPDNRSGHPSYHLSLSLDFKEIIPQHSSFGRLAADLLNGFYIPAPAVQLYPHPGFKLVFYGQP